MIWLVSALTLGLLGSFHCIGMCGPIAIALPVHQLSPVNKFTAIALYNVGRAITYSIFGLVFGLLGQGFFMAGFQQTLSVTLGVLLLLSALLPAFFTKLFPGASFMQTPVNALKLKLRHLFAYQSLPALFLIGLLNGLLPCGLVYVGIAGAMAMENYLQGAAFMFVFGLGTFPVMVSVSIFGQFISIRLRNTTRKIIPLAISAVAVLLVLRGLNLGIPYVSPEVNRRNMVLNSSTDSSTVNGKRVLKCCAKPKAEISQEVNINTTNAGH